MIMSGPTSSDVNVPQNLRNQGLIKHNAYSIFLPNYETATGGVLFGGIDEEKFNGGLSIVKLSNSSAFNVKVNNLTVGDQDIKTGNLTALLDTGTTFCYFPSSMSE